MYRSSELQKRGGSPINFFKDINDPIYAGPGAWYIIHSQSIGDPKTYLELIRQLSIKFFCDNCLIHMREYLKLNPPENFQNILVERNGKQEKLGLFLWAWQFHNDVNKRLGKPLMSWETACDLYLKSDSCSETCSLSH